MTTSSQSSINLGLPAVPEITDQKLFYEFVKVYNAIKLLAQGIDDYTGSGTLVSQVEESDTTSSVLLEDLSRKLKAIYDHLDQIINFHADFAELKKQYRRYTVPNFLVTGKFACNGASAKVAQSITEASSTAPAGSVGTAAGAWDTAANRDLAIAAINANAAAITEIQNILKAFGLGI